MAPASLPKSPTFRNWSFIAGARRDPSPTHQGHAEEMAAWADFLRGQTEHPLAYEKSRVSMLLTFAVLESIQRTNAVELSL